MGHIIISRWTMQGDMRNQPVRFSEGEGGVGKSLVVGTIWKTVSPGTSQTTGTYKTPNYHEGGKRKVVIAKAWLLWARRWEVWTRVGVGSFMKGLGRKSYYQDTQVAPRSAHNWFS
jgi:hypothetical protein